MSEFVCEPVKGDTMRDSKAERARIRIDAARKHLADAMPLVGEVGER